VKSRLQDVATRQTADKTSQQDASIGDWCRSWPGRYPRHCYENISLNRPRPQKGEAGLMYTGISSPCIWNLDHVQCSHVTLGTPEFLKQQACRVKVDTLLSYKLGIEKHSGSVSS